jgi:hypothetical protein
MKALAKHVLPSAGTLILVALWLLSPGVGAQQDSGQAGVLAPSQTLISYQGTLTTQSGAPVNATLPMDFALYDAASEGNLLWGPETQNVQVTDGLFSVLLGSVLPMDPANLAGDLYLDVTVNGEVLSPRERLTSVPNAVEAGTLSAGATTLGSLNVGGWLGVEGTNGKLRFLSNPSAGDFNIYHMESGTKELSIFGSGSAASMDVELYDGDLTVRAGTLDMNGNTIVNCGALIEANLQAPEELVSQRITRFEEGDLLCWGDGRLEQCTRSGDPLVQAVADVEGRPIVIGAELVKVVGPVQRGDYLVASEAPGYAKATRSPAFGTVIAQALEDFAGGKGRIKAMIRKM